MWISVWRGSWRCALRDRSALSGFGSSCCDDEDQIESQVLLRSGREKFRVVSIVDGTIRTVHRESGQNGRILVLSDETIKSILLQISQNSHRVTIRHEQSFETKSFCSCTTRDLCDLIILEAKQRLVANATALRWCSLQQLRQADAEGWNLYLAAVFFSLVAEIGEMP